MEVQQVTWWDRLKTNVRLSYKMAVNWVLFGSGLAWTWYITQPQETQIAVLAWLPIEPHRLPFLVIAIAYVARVWPQIKLFWEAQQAGGSKP